MTYLFTSADGSRVFAEQSSRIACDGDDGPLTAIASGHIPEGFRVLQRWLTFTISNDDAWVEVRLTQQMAQQLLPIIQQFATEGVLE